MNNFTRNDFNKLVSFLRKQGYNVKVETQFNWLGVSGKHELTGEFATIKEKNIYVGFVWVKDNPDNFYRNLADRLAGDPLGCFDKWSKCSLIVSLPQDHNQILKWLKILGTKEAFELSNSYEEIPGLPHE